MCRTQRKWFGIYTIYGHDTIEGENQWLTAVLWLWPLCDDGHCKLHLTNQWATQVLQVFQGGEGWLGKGLYSIRMLSGMGNGYFECLAVLGRKSKSLRCAWINSHTTAAGPAAATQRVESEKERNVWAIRLCAAYGVWRLISISVVHKYVYYVANNIHRKPGSVTTELFVLSSVLNYTWSACT